MIFTEKFISNKNEQWIINSGSSQHVTSNLNLLYYKEEINEEMFMSNKYTDPCTIKGKIKIKITRIKIILTNIYYIKVMKNLISMNKLMEKDSK